MKVRQGRPRKGEELSVTVYQRVAVKPETYDIIKRKFKRSTDKSMMDWIDRVVREAK